MREIRITQGLSRKVDASERDFRSLLRPTQSERPSNKVNSGSINTTLNTGKIIGANFRRQGNGICPILATVFILLSISIRSEVLLIIHMLRLMEPVNQSNQNSLY